VRVSGTANNSGKTWKPAGSNWGARRSHPRSHNTSVRSLIGCRYSVLLMTDNPKRLSSLRQVISDETDGCRQNNPPVRLLHPAVQHRHDAAIVIEDRASRGAGRAVAVDLDHAGQHLARCADGQRGGRDDVGAMAFHGKVESQRVTDDRHRVAALQTARV